MKKYMIALFSLMLLVPEISQAVPYQFHKITNNNVENLANQLVVDVSLDLESNQAFFTFTNNVGIASSITDIYFDLANSLTLAPLMSYAGLVQSAGVNFSNGANPSNLPSGRTINFRSDQGFDSNAPVMRNGINRSSESLILQFDFTTSFDSILMALNTGALRIGAHVQAIGDGGSDSYVTGTVPVPEPTTMLLFGTGLIGLAGLARRKNS